MSAPDEELYNQLMLTEPSIAKVTEAAVAKALEGFALTPQRDMVWLARAIQGALFTCLGNSSEGPERASDAATRDELKKLASRASQLRFALQTRSSAADSAACEFAFRNSKGGGGTDMADGLVMESPALLNRFNALLSDLDWLPDFLLQAANSIRPPSGPWRQSERRERRVLRAQCLSPIYETAFGAEATVNTWPGQTGGPWPDFYRRIVALAFNESRIPDWEGVLDEGRRRHAAQRVKFAAGIIPD